VPEVDTDVFVRASEFERLTRERNEAIGQAEQWRMQAAGLDHDLIEAKAEIERLRSEVQGVQLGAEGMGWAPRRSHD
jgi:recombinational DNA repair ATPase RecF